MTDALRRGWARYLWAALAALLLSPGPATADEATVISNPAEKYAMTPGGVDIRTGQYVYSDTDLAIGPKDGGLQLTRSTPVYVDGHTNPFGNFSTNWDIMLIERRIGLTPPMETGPDFRLNVHAGGRSFVFESQETAPAYGYKSDGPAAWITFAGGTKASDTVVYTVRGPDGTLYVFRPMGSKDCATVRRCAFVSQITQPDGTVLTFDYAYDSLASANRAKLLRVTSSRGYVLMLEWSGSKVGKSCVINAATAVPPGGATCPGTALATVTYAYDGSGRLTSVTAPDSSVSQFTYTAVAGGTAMAFIKPGFATPWLTNTFAIQLDEEEVPHEVTNQQVFGDGRTFTYYYDLAPITINKPMPARVGGTVIDAHGHQLKYQYDWPILPGSRQRICSPPPCPPPTPDDEYKYTYQQTTSPVLVVDELGRQTGFDFCDPVTWAGLPVQEIDRCALVKNYNYFLPEGGTGPVSGARPDVAAGRVEFDPNGNVVKETRYPKPGSTLPAIITEAQFGAGFFTQTKPIWRKDALGNQADYTYDAAHGGILTETGPAVNGIRPQKRYSYAQRYAWIKSGVTWVQAAAPIWVLTSESFCKTSAWTGSACSAGASDEVVTAYDYGPNSGPNNLLLRGTAVTADGTTRRTCFGYDEFGRKISQTTPNANLGSCP